MWSDTVQFLPHINARYNSKLTPDTIIGCVVPDCLSNFYVKNGVAIEGVGGDGEAMVGIFCSHACYLRFIPIPCCWRA